MIEQSAEVTYPRPGACVVTVYGDQDRGTAEQFEQQLSDLIGLHELVVVDVGKAEFVDSSFLRNVLVADRRAREHAKHFRLQMGTAPIVRRAFEVSGILDRLEIAHSRKEALASPTEAEEARDEGSPGV